MRSVRAGHEIVVTDREQAVAKLVPFNETKQPMTQLAPPEDPSSLPLGKLQITPVPFCGTDSLAMLMEDRKR